MMRSAFLFWCLAVGWLAVATILFCLPGSALPSGGWMDAVYFDKWVHIGIFSGLCFLWSRALNVDATKGLVIISLAALSYGLLIEIIQDQLIPNRSFDVYDLAADAVGIIGGLWLDRYIKK